MESPQCILFIGRYNSAALGCKSILTAYRFSSYIQPSYIFNDLNNRIEQTQPDVIILDVDNSSSVKDSVIKQTTEIALERHIPCLLAISSNDSDSTNEMAGIGDFIYKPFNPNELNVRINKLLKNNIVQDNAQIEHLKQTIIARDKLYSNVAHDLRSPIASVKMLLKAILMKMETDKADAKMIDMIEMCDKTSENIFLLLDNLLKWVRVKANTLSLNIVANNVVDIINNEKESMLSLISTKGMAVMLDTEEKKLNAMCDLESIKVVIRNLLSNAVKFSHENSAICITIREKEGYIVVNVKDNGVGISSENRDKIFNEAEHFSTFGTNDEDGCGLGLILSRSIVLKNNGNIWFESEEGKGSTFSFSLPCAKS